MPAQIRMLVAAEALLGRKVVDAAGKPVGVVVDVGTGERWSPKFLLVGPARPQPRPHPIVRVEIREVAALTEDAVQLRN